MAVVLGIHNGHHASCAVVRDGVVVAAIQQERLTRVKGQGADGLTNLLPVAAVLSAAGTRIDQLDLIVSSFQAMGPGGIGLQRPLFEPGFGLFDPYDKRHFVISHHLAHALCAFGTSGFENGAALVCDLAGSTTIDGRDFGLPFSQFESALSELPAGSNVLTECFSIYDVNLHAIELRHREFCIPHNTPEIFVCSVASLYDNVSRAIFDKEDAHGQLMALAAMAAPGERVLSVHEIVDIDIATGAIRFKNSWQAKQPIMVDALANAPLAHSVQSAAELALETYARRARSLCSSGNLVVSGGVMLNIPAMSRLWAMNLFSNVHVPSAPHDAGVSIGCAYYGWRLLRCNSQGMDYRPLRSTDRLGVYYDEDEIASAIRSRDHLIFATHVNVKVLAEHLRRGEVVARCAGRAEFGPRALGARSLLANPLRQESKSRLNRIKGRQAWRPVAPVVLREAVREFFEGPDESPYMNFSYAVHPHYAKELGAVVHFDGTARVQTLELGEDPELYCLLEEFRELTGYPILANTSLNGPGEPIIETPIEAIDFFLCNDDIDCLVVGPWMVRRRELPELNGLNLASDTVVTLVTVNHERRAILIRGRKSLEMSMHAFAIVDGMEEAPEQELDRRTREEITSALRRGFLTRANC